MGFHRRRGSGGARSFEAPGRDQLHSGHLPAPRWPCLPGHPGLPAPEALRPPGEALPARALGPADTHVVPLEQPVPPHWTVVEQDFVLCWHSCTPTWPVSFSRPHGPLFSRHHASVLRARRRVPGHAAAPLPLAMEKGRHMECHCPTWCMCPWLPSPGAQGWEEIVFAVDGELLISEAVPGQVLPSYFWMVSGYRESPPSLKPQPLTPQEVS